MRNDPPHVITARDRSPDELQQLFAKALWYKHNFKDRGTPLAGAVMATLFYEASTRTKFSHEFAIKHLGGNTVGTENAKEFSSAAKGERLYRSLKNVAGYRAFAIVVRHHQSGEIKRAIEQSNIQVPVINAGDGSNEHPTQSWLDLFTLSELVGQGRLPQKGQNLLFFGDNQHSRTVRSLAYLAASHGDALGINVKSVTFAGVNGHASPQQDVIDALRAADIKVSIIGNAERPDQFRLIEECVRGTDVSYVTRSQRERHASNWFMKRINRLAFLKQAPLVFTTKLANSAPPHMAIMHPQPIVDEIPDAMDTNPHAYYDQQSENGLYLRMALLSGLAN